MPHRVVRALDRLAPRSCTARNTTYKQSGRGQTEGEQRNTRKQRRRRKASRMRDVWSLELAQMLWHGTSELRNTVGCPVRMLVDSLIRLGRAETEVSRNIDHTRPSTRARRSLQETIDQRRRHPMRSRRKHGRLRCLHEQLLHFRLRLECRIRESVHQVRKSPCDRLARLTVRHDGRKLELRMASDQAQHFSFDVTATTENNRWNARA